MGIHSDMLPEQGDRHG